MGFTELTRTTAVKNAVPEAGALVSTRAAGRGTTKSKYLAVKLGAKVAQALGFHLADQPVSVAAGNGDDAGKLAITCDAKSKFRAKKQTGGDYLVTVQGSALAGRLELPAEHVVIQQAWVIPAQGNKGPVCILKVQ